VIGLFHGNIEVTGEDMNQLSEEEVLKERKFLHDLNNKLAISQGRSELLKMLLDNVEEDEFVKQLKEHLGESLKGIYELNDLIQERRKYIKNE
jgi:hypothetical protein